MRKINDVIQVNPKVFMCFVIFVIVFIFSVEWYLERMLLRELDSIRRSQAYTILLIGQYHENDLLLEKSAEYFGLDDLLYHKIDVESTTPKLDLMPEPPPHISAHITDEQQTDLEPVESAQLSRESQDSTL